MIPKGKHISKNTLPIGIITTYFNLKQLLANSYSKVPFAYVGKKIKIILWVIFMTLYSWIIRYAPKHKQ